MLKLVIASYKMSFSNFNFMFLFSLPLLALIALNIYLVSSIKTNSLITCLTYISTILLPFVSAATDISIYRKLFKFDIINPLSSIKAYIRYLITQLGIGLLSSAPMFLINFTFLKFGFSPLFSICLAAIGNIFIGFVFMARFYVILPLIIQNKITSPRDFMSYTKQSYAQWILVTTLIYMPYVVIHYITIRYPYLNAIFTTLATFLFISFNVSYINSHRINKTTSKIANEAVIAAPVIAPKEKIKADNEEPKIQKKSSKKAQSKKATTKKAAEPKKANKRPSSRLKPATV